MLSTILNRRRHWLLAAGLLALTAGSRQAYPQSAPQTQANATRADAPYIVEWVYATKWGYFDEWYAIFKKYQIAILDKEKEQGLVTKYIVQRGGSHSLGEESRWDLRVLIYYKSREAQAAGRGIGPKLFPDQATFRKEEQERWRLTSRHWDLPITEVDPHTAPAGSN
ncbi:MAG: hypothetical protein ABSC05_16675 [Candidatus Solibacter sp.]|jgi:hypothetical protein